MLLQGLVRCGACGAGMTTHYTSRGKTRYSYYVCQRAQKEGAAACRGSRVAVGKLEHAVVEEVRAIGRAPELIEESLRTVGREAERMKPELQGRLGALEAERERLEGETRNLVDAVAKGGEGSRPLFERLGELHLERGRVEALAHELRSELVAIGRRVIVPEDLHRAIESFDPVWGELFPEERARIFRLLVERVIYDARTGETAVEFRPGGVRALLGDRKEMA